MHVTKSMEKITMKEFASRGIDGEHIYCILKEHPYLLDGFEQLAKRMYIQIRRGAQPDEIVERVHCHLCEILEEQGHWHGIRFINKHARRCTLFQKHFQVRSHHSYSCSLSSSSSYSFFLILSLQIFAKLLAEREAEFTYDSETGKLILLSKQNKSL